ncbi:MAG: (Fe-S)-binding protein [Thiotrichales bacterium]|nr:(Fe-S)-binding protein [Thiotrichales bacterium]
MPKRTKVLKTPYSAYLRAESSGFDEELCRVARATPCGEYLRRFWQPVCIESELNDTPTAVRIMGEDLVVFKDGAGRVGLLERRCVHRGTSLEFGKIVERGIRCCYHGWHFDVDGSILETPGEPADSSFRHKICQGAYPVHVWRGVVFAYMGPPDEKPPFPVFDTFEHQEAEGRLWSGYSPCNWLQVQENETDPIHLTFLHTRLFGVQFEPVYQEIPTMEWLETPVGMIYVTVRRWGDFLYLRSNDMLMPNMVRVAGIDDAEGETLFDRRGSAFSWVVPIDDTSCYNIGWSDIDKGFHVEGANGYVDRQLAAGKYVVGAGDIGQTGEPSYEDRQRTPGDWDAWVSQGPVTLHSREHLASTDRGVTMYRKMVRKGIRAVAKGKQPKGLLHVGGDTRPTYCHNTVARIPALDDKAADRELQFAFGREVTRRVLSHEYGKDEPGCADVRRLDDIRRVLAS